MKAKKLLSIFAILFIVLISGCASDDFNEVVGVCPVVESTNPSNGVSGVPLNQIITATFNEEMNPVTIDQSSFILTMGGIPVSGTVGISGATATFTPTSLLAANTIYTVKITTLAKDLTGNALQTDYVWTFTTGLMPIVISTDPAPNSTNVPLDKIISATFNMPMNSSTLNATTYTVKQGATTLLGTISYSGSTISFTPITPLEVNKLYTATITTGAKNVAGTAMANNYVWNFTTRISVVIPPITSGLNFGVFGGNAGITNQGLLTRINNGNVGTTAASTLVTGFTDLTTGAVYTVTPLNNGLVSGRVYAAPPAPGSAASETIATQGLVDANAAYISISPASMPGGNVIGTTDQGGKILPAGIYTSATTINIIGGDLTLNGSATDIWIFQAGSALTVGGTLPRSVKLTGGALAKNVYWYVGSQAVINYAGGGVMTGTIIANSGVTLSSPANSTTPVGQETVLNGKAISLVATVTMVNTIINIQ